MANKYTKYAIKIASQRQNNIKNSILDNDKVHTSITNTHICLPHQNQNHTLIISQHIFQLPQPNIQMDIHIRAMESIQSMWDNADIFPLYVSSLQKFTPRTKLLPVLALVADWARRMSKLKRLWNFYVLIFVLGCIVTKLPLLMLILTENTLLKV